MKEVTRFLVVNADDFGLTNGVNRGIIEAHEQGIVTSASLMVRAAAAEGAAEYARKHPEFSVGLHFEVEEWRCREGEWERIYQLVEASDAHAVRGEFERQLAAFERLLGRAPTHLDSHQHVHLKEPARSILLESAGRLRVPLRSCNSQVRYRGDFYGQTGAGDPYPAGISEANLLQTLGDLSPGWTELGCHPGYTDGLDSVYHGERQEEVRALCSAAVRAAVRRDGLQLCSFGDFRP